MRLDKYLKVSRLIKRRTVANEACDAGRVLVNDRPAKASVNVKAGDIIGLVGSTAAAEADVGPHLHFSVSRDGAVIDPHDYVNGGE